MPPGWSPCCGQSCPPRCGDRLSGCRAVGRLGASWLGCCRCRIDWRDHRAPDRAGPGCVLRAAQAQHHSPVFGFAFAPVVAVVLLVAAVKLEDLNRIVGEIRKIVLQLGGQGFAQIAAIALSCSNLLRSVVFLPSGAIVTIDAAAADRIPSTLGNGGVRRIHKVTTCS